MSIATYAELVAAVGDWLDRADLASRVPTFIQMAEARLNRLLADPEMDVTTTTTASSNATALPSDFAEMISVSVGHGKLQSIGPVEFATYNTSITGTPTRYAVIDNAIHFAPANASAVITMVYRRGIPALGVTLPTNWLLARAPDVYLYGALVQASGFLSEDDRIGMWKAAFDEAIAELRQDGERRKWGAGTLAPRIARP